MKRETHAMILFLSFVVGYVGVDLMRTSANISHSLLESMVAGIIFVLILWWSKVI